MLTFPHAISVDVDGHPYPVVLAETLDGLGDELSKVLPVGRCMLVSNEVVAPLHAAAALASLTAAGWQPERLLIRDGEAEKNESNWFELVNALLAARVDRRTPILALGGGVTGDLVGFAAASVLRGLPFVQVPTTLLAMVDASVGGKTGVNTQHGKNLLGAFWQPALVYAAQSTLLTLPDAELRCGLGEVVKHALISGEPALAACEAQAGALVARETSALARVVADSVRCKADVVTADPRENGVRATLNLGHTVAHAIEAVVGYGGIRHGEAVALGLIAVCRYAQVQGWMTEPDLVDRVHRLLLRLGLPVAPPPGLILDDLVAAAGFDKKRSRGMLTIVVPVAVGRVELRSIPLDELRSLTACLFAEPRSFQ